MQGETSIIRAQAETTVGITKDGGLGGGRCRPQLALLQVSSFDTRSDGKFDGCTRGDMGLYVRVYMCVYIMCTVFMRSPPTLFFSTLKGDFPVASSFGKSN